MTIATNDSYIVVIGNVAFKLGATFGSAAPHSPDAIELIEPGHHLRQADFHSDSHAVTTTEERRLPGRGETYSQIGENVFQIHRGGDLQRPQRLTTAQSEALRNDTEDWTPLGEDVEICAPKKPAASKRPIALTYISSESDHGA